MKDGPAFQMYSDLFYIDTAEWDPYEVGIYTRLLMCEWANGSLPDDEIKLQRLAGSTPKRFQKAYQTVKVKFHLNGNGRLINDKMEEVRDKQRKYRELQAERGKKSAIKRWGNGVTSVITTVEPALQPDDKPQSNSSSSSSSSLKINTKEQANAPFNLPLKEEIEQASEPMILGLVDQICLQIYKTKIFPEVNAFKNKMLKEKKNPRSILHTLCRVYLKREFQEGPWAYCLKIIEIEDKKYNARDYEKTS